MGFICACIYFFLCRRCLPGAFTYLWPPEITVIIVVISNIPSSPGKIMRRINPNIDWGGALRKSASHRQHFGGRFSPASRSIMQSGLRFFLYFFRRSQIVFCSRRIKDEINKHASACARFIILCAFSCGGRVVWGRLCAIFAHRGGLEMSPRYAKAAREKLGFFGLIEFNIVWIVCGLFLKFFEGR